MAQLSRFHAGDLVMRSVHRYGRLDDYAAHCESIRLRIGQQLGAVRAKHELWLSLADQDKVAALREIPSGRSALPETALNGSITAATSSWSLLMAANRPLGAHIAVKRLIYSTHRWRHRVPG